MGFLLRGTALLIVLLTLWWLFLLSPLLSLLRSSVEMAGGMVFGGDSRHIVTETDSGDWTIRIPAEGVTPMSSQGPRRANIHSIEFDIARSDVNAFTFSLPVYWAILLAAPALRRNVRALVLGTILMGVVEVILFLVFAEVYAHKVAAQLSPAPGGTPNWSLRFIEYIVVSVIPYLAPFLIAISLHRELRWQTLRWEPPVGETTPTSAEGC